MEAIAAAWPTHFGLLVPGLMGWAAVGSSSLGETAFLFAMTRPNQTPRAKSDSYTDYALSVYAAYRATNNSCVSPHVRCLWVQSAGNPGSVFTCPEEHCKVASAS